MKRLLTAILTAAVMLTPIVSSATPAPQGYFYFYKDFYTVGGVTLSETDTNNYHDVWYDLDDIADGSTVYFKVRSEEGYYCESVTFNSVMADAHTFIMPEGEIEVSAVFRLLGDMNRDEKVNLTDVSALLRHLARHGIENLVTVTPDRAGDFNSDGKTNLLDAALILKTIAGYEIELEPTQIDYGYKVNYIGGTVLP